MERIENFLRDYVYGNNTQLKHEFSIYEIIAIRLIIGIIAYLLLR